MSTIYFTSIWIKIIIDGSTILNVENTKYNIAPPFIWIRFNPWWNKLISLYSDRENVCFKKKEKKSNIMNYLLATLSHSTSIICHVIWFYLGYIDF